MSARLRSLKEILKSVESRRYHHPQSRWPLGRSVGLSRHRRCVAETDAWESIRDDISGDDAEDHARSAIRPSTSPTAMGRTRCHQHLGYWNETCCEHGGEEVARQSGVGDQRSKSVDANVVACSAKSSSV